MEVSPDACIEMGYNPTSILLSASKSGDRTADERLICRAGLDEGMKSWIGSREGVVRDYVRVYGLNAYNLVFRRDEI